MAKTKLDEIAERAIALSAVPWGAIEAREYVEAVTPLLALTRAVLARWIWDLKSHYVAVCPVCLEVGYRDAAGDPCVLHKPDCALYQLTSDVRKEWEGEQA